MANKKKTKKIRLSDMDLREKIAQMIVTNGNDPDKRYSKISIGGRLVWILPSEKDFKETIKKYKKDSKIEPFIVADLEGYWNPFVKFYNSKFFSEVKDSKEAYKLGKEHGKILKRLGFHINFSPVVEVRNNVWPERTFKGSLDEVKEKIKSYIRALQGEGIMATAKHYPGGSMVKDPHFIKYKTKIFRQDLELFDVAIGAGVKAIMIEHPIVEGLVDSKGKQASISPHVVLPLRKKFKGLIFSDAITMKGLRKSFRFNFKKVYPAVVKAGNDIVLDTDAVPKTTFESVFRGIKEIEKEVRKGNISEKRIDASVRKILQFKGYHVVD